MTKTRGRILLMFITAFILIMSVFIVVFYKMESSLQKKIPQWVAEKSDNLYRLSFSNLDVNIFPVSVTVSDVTLSPEENISKKVLEKSPGSAIYSFRSEKLSIKNIALFSLWKKQKFLCKNITVTRPVLEISGEEWFQNDSVRSFEKLLIELRPLIKTSVKEIGVGNIKFIDANYRFFNTTGNTAQVSNARQISVEIKKFRTDSALVFGKNKLFDSDDILIRMNDFRNMMGDSLHVLKIDTLEYSLKSSDIFASGFHLTPAFKNPGKSLYDVFVPKLSMKSKSLTRFAFNDSIKVQHLNFQKPRIRFYQKENPKQIDIDDINNFNLYALIEKQFSKIEVDSFYLSDASLEIYRQPDTVNYQQKFTSIDIILNGFALDSTSSRNPDKLLHADNLEMTVSGYHLRLEDNEHDFRADSMFVSTFSNSFGTKKITILPVNHIQNVHSRLMVNIDCEALEISDVDLKALYRTRKLPTKKIEITKPNVRLAYHTEIQKSKNQNETGLLFQLISAYLKGVYSETVFVDEGVLNIQNLYKNKVMGYFETGFGFNLSGFSLDSASIKNTDKFFYANNFDLEFSDYQMRLVDDLHKITADRVSILNFERKVEIENLRLQPVVDDVSDSIMQQFNRSELYHIEVPRITLLGVNLRNAFFNNKLNITSFRISNPKIHLENFGALRASKKQKEFSEFYALLFNYLNDFNISKIEIPNGELTWVNHTKKGKTISFDNRFSATLENFRLNEKELEKKRLLFSDNFDISVKDQMFQLSDSVHYLRAGEIHLSTARSEVNIKNALLYPLITAKKYHNLPTTFQVSIPQLHISNIDFQKAFYSKELVLNELELNAPKIQVYSKTGDIKTLDLNKFKFPLPSMVSTIKIAGFKINKGEVQTYETVGLEQHASGNFWVDLQIPAVSVTNNLNKQAQIKTGNILASITGLKTPIGKSHNLKIGHIDYNRNQKTIVINQLNVTPFSEKNTENQFTIAAPKITLNEFDINKALKENHFGFGEIAVEKPDITIKINGAEKDDKLEAFRNLDLYPYIEPYVDEIKIKRLRMNDIKLNFNRMEKKLVDRKIDLDFREIYIAENQSTGNLLNSKEFEVSTTNLKTRSKNNLYEFTADSLIYNSAKHNIILKKIKVTPLLQPEEFPRRTGFQTDYAEAATDFIELQGVDENLWVKENRMSARLLKIGKTDASVFRNKRFPFNHGQRPPWPQDLLKNIKQPFVFDSLALLPSNVRYSELTDISDEPGTVEFNRLTLKTGKISNMPGVFQTQKKLNIDASAQLYQNAAISAQLSFDLTSDNYLHALKGSLGPLPFQRLNAMIEKSAPVTVESGQITRFDFDFVFTDKNASGELYFGYDDFKISILDFNDDGAKKSKLASFWANKMILNSKNPKGNTFLPEKVFYERDVERSVINYWWKTIFTGAKQTLGIKPDEPDPK